MKYFSGPIRYFYLFAGLFYLFFVYASLKGKRFTGTDSEKWEAKGANQIHHK